LIFLGKYEIKDLNGKIKLPTITKSERKMLIKDNKVPGPGKYIKNIFYIILITIIFLNFVGTLLSVVFWIKQKVLNLDLSPIIIHLMN
jgi:hypothetical protein